MTSASISMGVEDLRLEIREVVPQMNGTIRGIDRKIPLLKYEASFKAVD